jgi:hypothetical protein
MKTMTVFFLFIALCISIPANSQVLSPYYGTNPVRVKPVKEAPDTLHRQKGYFNNTQTGMGVRLGKAVLSISTVNGCQFSRHISLGLGVGYTRTYLPLWNSWELIGAKMIKSDYHVNVDHLDLFIENRLFLGNKKSAFLLFDLGYSFFLAPKAHELTAREKSEYWSDFPYVWGDSLEKITYTGRIFLAPGAGMRIFIHKNLSLNVSVQLYVSGYLITQHYQSESAYDPPYATNKLKINLYPLLSIGIGF